MKLPIFHAHMPGFSSGWTDYDASLPSGEREGMPSGSPSSPAKEKRELEGDEVFYLSLPLPAGRGYRGWYPAQ
jgi:hypothetical protein